MACAMLRRASMRGKATLCRKLAKAGILVGAAGFEPTTLCPPDKCATRLRYAPTARRHRETGVLAQPRIWRKGTTRVQHCHCRTALAVLRGPEVAAAGQAGLVEIQQARIEHRRQ